MKWLMLIIQSVLRIWANKTDPENRKRDHAEKTETNVEKAVNASRKKDAAAVNKILRSGKFKCVVALCALTISGCRTPMMIVPQAEAVVPLVHNGIDGWFVPQPTFEVMLEAVVRQQNKED
jgi:hypothetical protein